MQREKGNGLLLAVICVAILALVTAGYFFYQNQQLQKLGAASPKEEVAKTVEAKNWKTYTNTKNNFSIDYPADWSVEESDSKNDVSLGSVSVDVGQKSGGYNNTPLEEYAKVAANREIQNYNELVLFKKITTTSNITGYETTWKVQAIMGGGSGSSESLPITYFEMPGNKTLLLRVTLDKEVDLSTYEKMLTTVKITAPAILPPPVDEGAVLKTVIRKYISLKSNAPESSLTVTVSKIEGSYAKGMVSDVSSGGLWFAAKEDDVWKLVWDGNGVIECSTLTLYPNFPASLIPECFDPKTQETVKR